MKIFTATDFVRADHGIGKETIHAKYLVQQPQVPDGLVNVRIKNGGIGIYEQGKLQFSIESKLKVMF